MTNLNRPLWISIVATELVRAMRFAMKYQTNHPDSEEIEGFSRIIEMRYAERLPSISDSASEKALKSIVQERQRQDSKWGEQNPRLNGLLFLERNMESRVRGHYVHTLGGRLYRSIAKRWLRLRLLQLPLLNA